TPAAIIRIAVGAALLVGAVVKWRARPRGADEPKLPGWMRSIDNASPVRAFRLGFLLTAANVKEIAFAAGVGFTIGGAFLPWGQIALSGALFVVLACLSVAIPVAAGLLGGERVQPVLSELRTWLVRNNAIVVAIVLLVLGAMLVGGGISGL
ncbi:MAG: GAP family protein, partial [Mycetocola sp.]